MSTSEKYYLNPVIPHLKYMNPHAQSLGSLGGKARAQNSTLEQRKEWGKKGGRPRKNVDN